MNKPQRTHYENCWKAHLGCAKHALRSIMEEMVGHGNIGEAEEAHIKTALNMLEQIWYDTPKSRTLPSKEGEQ